MHLGLVLDGLAVHDVVPPLVDGLVPVHLLAGTTYHQDVLHGSVAARELGDGTVHGRLECGRGAAAVTTVGGDDHLGAAVLDPGGQGVGGEAAEHDRVRGAEAGAGEHRDDTLGEI